MTSQERPTDVIKWFTRARKFPQLLGKTPDGTKLWGGPYTITQAAGGGLVLLVGLKTMDLWASYGLLGNTVALACAIGATVFGLGRVPLGSRNPFNVAAGLLRAMAAPAAGRLGGRQVRIRRPHQVRHRIVAAVPATATARPAPVSAPAPPATPAPVVPLAAVDVSAPRPRPVRRPAVTPVEAISGAPVAFTGVQTLLAAGTKSQNEGTER